jgi:single-strand DNA-binding protein
MDLNLVVLVGRLAAPAELRVFETGSRLVRLLVSVKVTEPRERLDVVPVMWWEPSADAIDHLPEREQLVWVSGSLQRRFWDGPEGRRSRFEVVAEQVAFTRQTAKDLVMDALEKVTTWGETQLSPS